MSGLAAAGPEDMARLLALGELLGRPAIAFDEFPLRKLVRNRRILVTGAGPSAMYTTPRNSQAAF